MADELTIVLNGVAADTNGFTKIGSIISMKGTISGKEVEISKTDGKGIDKDALNNALNAGNSIVPVINVDEAETDAASAEALRIQTEKDAEALKIQTEKDAEALKIQTEKDAEALKIQEGKDAEAEALRIQTEKDAKVNESNEIMRQMNDADQDETRGGRRRSRKAKRTKKGGKKRRNTLRRHR